jgi:glycosyltransferase involved in cell wall biosynthesis
MNVPSSLSIVIANYNYGRYVSQAIDSALAVDWPAVEIVVVDDGSKDDSREVIESYGDKVTAIFQKNAGQRAANNVGFAVTSGDMVVFLDADDLLDPAIAREVAAVWSPGASKVQVLMRRVDKALRPLGSVFPRLTHSPTPRQIRDWSRASMEYPTPPGSGNVYARKFLEKIFPLGDNRDSSTDSTCIAMAPFLGDVITVTKALVSYRIHGGNDSNMLSNDANFGREVARAVKRLRAAQDACAMQGLDRIPDTALRRGNHLLQLRAASLRLSPADHPLPGDGRFAAIVDSVLLPFRGGSEPIDRRLLIAAYSFLILVLPRSLARSMIRKRFSPR